MSRCMLHIGALCPIFDIAQYYFLNENSASLSYNVIKRNFIIIAWCASADQRAE